MRRIVWIFLIIFLACLVSADDSIFLSGNLKEGETKVYETKEGAYVISLLSVSEENEKAVFRLNDEASKGIEKGDSNVFKDGSEIVVRELVITESGEGVDEAYYYFYGTGEGVLKIGNVSVYAVENKLCNFDGQCPDETKEDCCYDCGCDGEERCENNECVLDEGEKKEAVNEEKVEEKEAQEDITEEDQSDAEGGIKKELGSEKKAAYSILVVMVVFILIMVWVLHKKRNSIF